MSDPETRARVSQKRKKKLADKERSRRDMVSLQHSSIPRSRGQRTKQVGILGEEDEIDLYPYADIEQGYPYDFDFEYWRRKYDLPDEELD